MARRRSAFHTAWRPFLGWCCCIAVLNAYTVVPWLAAAGLPAPVLAGEHLVALVSTALGVGAMRTLEKLRGASTEGHSMEDAS